MLDEAQKKERQKEYARKYYKKNKEKIAKRNKEYKKEYYKENKEKIAERNKERRKNNNI